MAGPSVIDLGFCARLVSFTKSFFDRVRFLLEIA
jgi:hypothetical protein